MELSDPQFSKIKTKTNLITLTMGGRVNPPFKGSLDLATHFQIIEFGKRKIIILEI